MSTVIAEAVVMKLLDAALNAAAAGLEREAILGQVTKMQAAGASAENIAAELVRMRDAALSNLDRKLDAAS